MTDTKTTEQPSSSQPSAVVTAAGVLGAAAASTDIRTVPAAVKQRVIDILLDTIGVMAVGSDRIEHRSLQDLLATGGGGSTVIGRIEGAPASIAALLNGTLPTVYQIDEGHRLSRGHPGIHVVPVVLALAEERGLDADTLLSALLAGYEVGARVGLSLGGVKSDIHPHGNWGTIGAAAAAAYIYSGADAATIARAIDEAAAITLYPDRAATNAGAGVHHLYAAVGAHTGLVSAAAAQSGMTAVPGCLEDFMGPRSGAAFDREVLLGGVDRHAGVWSTFEIVHNYFKFYAACGHTHTAINALVDARRSGGFTADDVERIDVTAFRAAANLIEDSVDNDLAARYSIPYTLAATLLDDGYGIDSLSAARMQSPQLHELAKRVHVHYDAELDEGYPRGGRPVRVAVSLRDGRAVEASLSLSFGDEEIPASREALHDKAAMLFDHRFGPSASSEIVAAALELESGGDVGALSAALRRAAVAK